MKGIVRVNQKDLQGYQKARAAVAVAYNIEFQKIKEKAQAAALKNKEVILFSIPMSETLVRLSEQTLDNLFSSVKKDYPEHGLFLKEIQIIHQEYLGDDLQYYTKLSIKFQFSNEQFNNHWSRFQLSKLSFDDAELKFCDNSMGVCLNPTFVDAEKYRTSKKEVTEAMAKLIIS